MHGRGWQVRGHLLPVADYATAVADGSSTTPGSQQLGCAAPSELLSVMSMATHAQGTVLHESTFAGVGSRAQRKCASA
jgi:hypothetical protein